MKRDVVARGGGAALARREVAHHQQRGNHEPERDGVGEVDPPDAGHRNHQPGGGRTDDRGGLKHDRVQADGVGQMLARNERRHQGVARRQVEGADGRCDGRQNVNRPDGRHAAKRNRPERERDHRRRDLREEHQPPPVPRVGDDAADHREDDDREDADQADEAEREPFPLRRDEQRDVPQQRRVLHHRAGEGDEQTDPDQPVVAVLQRDERLAREQGATNAPGRRAVDTALRGRRARPP